MTFLKPLISKLGLYVGLLGLAITSFLVYTSKTKKKAKKKVIDQVNSKTVKEVLTNVEKIKKVNESVSSSSSDAVRNRLRNKYTRRNRNS